MPAWTARVEGQRRMESFARFLEVRLTGLGGRFQVWKTLSLDTDWKPKTGIKEEEVWRRVIGLVIRSLWDIQRLVF